MSRGRVVALGRAALAPAPPADAALIDHRALVQEDVAMGKVGRFITDPKAGAYCQVTLDSGDKLIVNHAKGGFKGGPLTIETTKWWGGGQRIVEHRPRQPGRARRRSRS